MGLKATNNKPNTAPEYRPICQPQTTKNRIFSLPAGRIVIPSMDEMYPTEEPITSEIKADIAVHFNQ